MMWTPLSFVIILFYGLNWIIIISRKTRNNYYCLCRISELHNYLCKFEVFCYYYNNFTVLMYMTLYNYTRLCWAEVKITHNWWLWRSRCGNSDSVITCSICRGRIIETGGGGVVLESKLVFLSKFCLRIIKFRMWLN